MKYGYCRISTPRQSIERQIRNILAVAPDAYIVEEVYTGTKVKTRKKWNWLLGVLKPGDTVYFDEVSRMARNAEEGFAEYEKLFHAGVELIFLKERHIDTATYKEAISKTLPMTGTIADHIFEGINNFILALAKEQIKLAFEQAEKEVSDLHQRTREGMITAKLNGKQIGNIAGRKLTTKKSVECKEKIRKHSKTFGGSLTDTECIRLLGIARNTFYKYKSEILSESGLAE